VQKADFEKPVLPSVPMKNCPIESSLGVLGLKWTLLVLRNIGFLKMERRNQMPAGTVKLSPIWLVGRCSGFPYSCA